MAKADLTAQRLRELLDYNPETGLLTRLVPPKRVTGSPSKRGYIELFLLGSKFRAHRLAFLYMTGDWPRYEVDHIDGNKGDNRWANLRDVPKKTNQENRRIATKSNKLGILGVCCTRGRYMASIQENGKKRTLGRFPTAEEAYAAYLDAKRLLHPGNTL
jgi:hypothetical protein